MSIRTLLVIAALTSVVSAAQPGPLAPDELPAMATTKLAQSLEAARAHTRAHLARWNSAKRGRDRERLHRDLARRPAEMGARHAGERSRDRSDDAGDSRWLSGQLRLRPADRVLRRQSFDALVLGPAIAGGETVPGIVVGLMYMEDEKGLDSKVVLSRPGPGGRPAQELTRADQERIGEYFKRYKEHELPLARTQRCRAGGPSPKACRS